MNSREAFNSLFICTYISERTWFTLSLCTIFSLKVYAPVFLLLIALITLTMSLPPPEAPRFVLAFLLIFPIVIILFLYEPLSSLRFCCISSTRSDRACSYGSCLSHSGMCRACPNPCALCTQWWLVRGYLSSPWSGKMEGKDRYFLFQIRLWISRKDILR